MLPLLHHLAPQLGNDIVKPVRGAGYRLAG